MVIQNICVKILPYRSYRSSMQVSVRIRANIMMSSAAVIYDGLEYLYYHQTIGRYQMLHCVRSGGIY